ncbi:MAG: alpha/beta hydrolase, partial [Candidatus Scatosoma sp.]
GLFVTDLIALADFMLALPCADKKKGLTCVGLSGGGMQTLLFAAVDKRVKQAIVSGYFYGAKKAMYDVPQCACNYPPRLWNTFDMRDLAALVAPRFLYIETGDRDPLNGGLENALREGEFAKKAYALAGAEERFRQEICSGGHRFYGQNSLPWLKSTVFNG